MPNQNINSLLSKYHAETLHFSTINEVEDLDAHVEDVVQFIMNHTSLNVVLVDEPLAIEDETKKKEIYDALVWNGRFARLYVGPLDSDGENKRFSLDLSITLWTAQVISDVVSLKLLRISRVDFDNELADVLASGLRRNKTLEEFYLRESNKNIESNACDIVVQAVATTLPSQSSLKTFFVKTCALSEAAFAAFAEVLELGHSSLKSLTIRSKESHPPQVAVNLLNAIGTNRTLKQASLGIFAADTDNLIGPAIARLLSNNSTLQQLSVWGPFTHTYSLRLDSEDGIDVTSFGSSLALNRSLKSFGLYGWGIGNRGIQNVCEAVMENQGIEYLGLWKSNFGVADMKAIKDLLSHETALTRIDVGCNRINDESVSFICDPLEENDTITTLDIYNNDIGDEGAVKLGRSLMRNTGLRCLDLEDNDSMGERGIRTILDAVKVHPSITEVNLGDSLDTAVDDELRFYLECNKGARKLLSVSPSVPLSLWPRVFKKADTCRRAPSKRKRAPDVLYYLVQEKVDLFSNIPASREQKRRRTK